MVGTIEGRRVAIGNVKMMESLSVSVDSLKEKADELRRTGQTVMFVAIDVRAAGIVGVADPCEGDGQGSDWRLACRRHSGRDADGDNRTTADAVARVLGID